MRLKNHDPKLLGGIPAHLTPQIVLLTFDDAVNDINKEIYSDLFHRGRTNPNGCPITATFYGKKLLKENLILKPAKIERKNNNDTILLNNILRDFWVASITRVDRLFASPELVRRRTRNGITYRVVSKKQQK